MPNIGGIWVVEPEDSQGGIVTLRAGSTAFLAFDFGNLPQIASGAEIAEASITGDPGLGDGDAVLGSVVLLGENESGVFRYRAGCSVQAVTVSGEDTPYLVFCTATLDDGSVLVARGRLNIV